MTDKLNSLYAKYQEYLTLSHVTSKNDPEEEPFLTKYVARSLISKEIEKLETTECLIPNESGLEGSEFTVSLDQKHLVKTYQFFLEEINSKCQEKFSMNSKKFLLIKLFQFNLAKNYVETEEIEAGERIFSKVLQQIETLCEDDPESYNPVLYNFKMSCFLELVFVWSNRSDYTKCNSLLTSVDVMHSTFKTASLKNYLTETNEFDSNDRTFTSMPFDPSEFIRVNLELTNDSRKNNFESLYTYSLFFSAQIYGKLDEKVKSAYYCQLTLQRQIDEHREGVTSPQEPTNENPNEKIVFKQQPLEKITFDPLDWATHAGALSQYYVCEGEFATARHCLCCADAILVKLNKDRPEVIKTAEDEEDPNYENPNAKLQEQTFSIRRCWGKYGIELLKFAKRKLLESSDEPSDTQKIHQELDKTSRFHFNLPTSLYDLKEIELNAITSNIPLDYEQARAVFLKTQKIMNDVKDFFVLDGYVTDHSEICRDISELYSCLIFFDPDLERRCKMQKRRLDIIIPICDEISEQYYLSLKRQYLFDVGSIYSELMDLKLEILSEKQEKQQDCPTKVSNAAAIAKINQLATKSITRFEAFLSSMKVQPARKVLPDKFDDHNVRPALLAKFYLGRLYSKLITTDSAKRLENCRLTLELYTYLVKYCDNHKNDTPPEIIASMDVEYSVCKEMIMFLPAKMDKLRALV